MKKILLIPKIDFLNFPLYDILSVFYQIKTYEIEPFLIKLRGKIEFIDLSNYCDWQDGIIAASDAVDIWRDILPRMPKIKHQIRINGDVVDLSLKFKKDLQREISKLLFLKKIIIFYREEKVYIVNSLKLNFLSKIIQEERLFSYSTIKWLSAIHILLERLSLALLNLARLVKTVYQLIYGLIYSKGSRKKISYIYDGVSTRELSIDNNDITFTWIVDDKLIRKDEVLFLLPKADFQMQQHSRDFLQDKKLLAVSYLNMFAFCSRKILFSLLPELFRGFIRVLLPSFTLGNLMITKYMLSIAKWVPIVESLSPKVYLTTFSNIGQEEVAMLYFNAKGVKTVEWFYGTNSYLFLNSKNAKDIDFSSPVFCNLMSQTLIVWNRHFKQFIEQHPQNDLEIRVIGPVMSADEKVMETDKNVLGKKLNLAYRSTLKYISIFDAPPVADKYRGSFARRPGPNSAEYNCAFIKDAYKLLSDLPKVGLIYKPKRSLNSGKFLYAVGLKELLEQMKQNQEVIILDYNVNPWVAVALADLCISIPFESPNIVALHYGKPTVFHDALNIAQRHRYGKIKRLITHDYEELKALVEELLFNPSALQSIYSLSDISDFVGANPGTNSSTYFRRLLKEYAKN